MSLHPVTLFTTCKPMTGDNAVFQKNALRSWARLGLDIIVLGDESGVAEVAREIGAHHIPDVARNDDGLPRIDALFSLAEAHADTDMLAYFNSDIILQPDFLDLVTLLAGQATGPFLTLSRRRTVPLYEEVDFSAPGYSQKLAQLSATEGSWDHPFANDMFFYSKGLFGTMPGFSVGRPMWDNWMLYKAASTGAQVIDASGTCTLLHPAHGYGSNWRNVIFGESAARNRSYGDFASYNLENTSTHWIDEGAIVPVSEESRALSQQKFALNEAAEVRAMVSYCDRSATHNAALLFDNIRALFWRVGRFFPLADDLSGPADDWHEAFVAARNSIAEGAYETALDQLQDMLCRRFLGKLKEVHDTGAPIVIWGAGGYGKRLNTFLKRHGLTPAFFVDRNAGQVNANVDGIDVFAPDALLTREGAAPVLLIGTMQVKAVLAGIEEQGITPAACLY